MRTFFLLLVFGFTFQLSATATVCNGEGEYCKEVSRVLIDSKWYPACCDNVSVPEGWSCTDDCPLAKNRSQSVDVDFELTRSNAYVKFTLGYAAWVVEDGLPNPMPKVKMDIEDLREYLPSAQAIFKGNSEVKRVFYKFQDGVDVIIERPENNAQLKEEIVWRDWDAVESKLASRYPKQVDVLPNPVVDRMEISINEGKVISEISISDVSGRVVFQEKGDFEGNSATITLEKVDSKKVYILRIIDINGRVYVRKFFKE